MLNQYELKFTKISEDKSSAVFSFEPLPSGFGHTLGSVLRRVALTSIKGSAVTSFRIPGITHQFTTLPGVKEDLVELSLNLKQLRFKSHSEQPVIGKITKKGPGVVTASDIEISSEVEIVNKDMVIATLADKNTSFEMELTVEKGVGYSPVEGREHSKLGTVLVDAIFSPVVNVSYTVESARVGRQSGLDKLVIDIQTDGSLKPMDVIKTSASILRDFFDKFSNAPEDSQDLTSLFSHTVASEVKSDNSSIDDLPLLTRTINALKKHGINSLSDLRAKSDEEISDIKNLGEKSIEEIRKLLGRK
jgi:DNA-directed RNA polymerase subunit alpha